MKPAQIYTISALIVFLLLASFPKDLLATAKKWGDDSIVTADCPYESTALAPYGILKDKAVGCRCNYQRAIETTTNKQVTVRCPDNKYVCTTNDFNSAGVNVCLLRLGQPCGAPRNDKSNTTLGEIGFNVTEDALCEGGTVCDANSKTCVVDTGDTTLSGALGSTTTDLRDTVRRFINIGLGFLGVLTVLMVIYGGFLWLTAAGEEEKVTKGKQVLTWAVIGAIVISIAWTISSYVLQIGRTVG